MADDSMIIKLGFEADDKAVEKELERIKKQAKNSKFEIPVSFKIGDDLSGLKAKLEEAKSKMKEMSASSISLNFDASSYRKQLKEFEDMAKSSKKEISSQLENINGRQTKTLRQEALGATDLQRDNVEEKLLKYREWAIKRVQDSAIVPDSTTGANVQQITDYIRNLQELKNVLADVDSVASKKNITLPAIDEQFNVENIENTIAKIRDASYDLVQAFAQTGKENVISSYTEELNKVIEAVSSVGTAEFSSGDSEKIKAQLDEQIAKREELIKTIEAQKAALMDVSSIEKAYSNAASGEVADEKNFAQRMQFYLNNGGDSSKLSEDLLSYYDAIKADYASHPLKIRAELELEKVEANIQHLQALLDSVGESSSGSPEVSKLQEELNAAKNTIESLKAELKELQSVKPDSSNIDEYVNKIKDLENTISELSEKLKNSMDENKLLGSEKESLTSSLENAKNEIQRISAGLKEAMSSSEVKDNQITDLKAQLEALQGLKNVEIKFSYSGLDELLTKIKEIPESLALAKKSAEEFSSGIAVNPYSTGTKTSESTTSTPVTTNTANATTTSGEASNQAALQAAVNSVTEAVNAKTAAFKNEASVVESSVNSELESLGILKIEIQQIAKEFKKIKLDNISSISSDLVQVIVSLQNIDFKKLATISSIDFSNFKVFSNMDLSWMANIPNLKALGSINTSVFKQSSSFQKQYTDFLTKNITKFNKQNIDTSELAKLREQLVTDFTPAAFANGDMSSQMADFAAATMRAVDACERLALAQQQVNSVELARKGTLDKIDKVMASAAYERFNGSSSSDYIDSSEFSNISNMIDKLKEIKNDPTKLVTKEDAKNAAELATNLERALKAITKNNNLYVNNKGRYVGQIASTSQEDLITQMRTMAQKVTADAGKKMIDEGNFSKDYTVLRYKVQTDDGNIQTMALNWDRATNSVREYMAQEEQYVSSGEKFISGLKEKGRQLLSYVTVLSVFNKVKQFIKSGVNVVREFDTAMTELRKTSDGTAEDYQKFVDAVQGSSKEVGATSQELTESAADWSRLGHNLQDSATMAKNVAILKNVSEYDNIQDATNGLISVMQAYSITADQSMDLIDKVNDVGNNYAISTDEIVDSLQRSSAALVAAGNTIDEAVALTTVANEVVQNPESVGAGLKTVSLRLRGTSEAKRELEESGEDVSDYTENISKLRASLKALTAVKSNDFAGFDILTDDGAYKSTYEILKGIGKIWKEIGEQSGGDLAQANILEKMFGKNRAQIGAAIVQNPDRLEEVMNTSLNASGSAARELDTYLDSIDAHVKNLTESFNQMWVNALDSDVPKQFLDIGSAILDLVDKFGLLNTAIAGIATIFSFNGAGRAKYIQFALF